MNKKTEHHEIELLFTDDSVHISLPSREPGIQYKIVNKSLKQL